jgi:hypothetical protein
MIPFYHPNQQEENQERQEWNQMDQVFFMQLKVRRKAVPYIKIKQWNPQTIKWFIDEMQNRKLVEKTITSGKGKAVQTIG